MKKRRISLIALFLIITISTISYSVSAEGKVNEPEEYILHSIKEDNIQPVKLTIEKTLSAVFEVNPTNNENQNTFDINVFNITSGMYKVIIVGANGYTFESDELTSETTIPMKNIDLHATYEIYVISTSATPFSANVNITSNTEE